MITIELIFFGLAALFALVGGFFTVAARSPIRAVMGLLANIVGIAGMYLLLSAELLAAIQILVYAGAVVVLFLFVIMLLGPSAVSSPDARSALPRYLAAGVFVVSAAAALMALSKIPGVTDMQSFLAAPRGFGSIESIGRQLFTVDLVPFELAGVLLLVAVIGAVAVARGKQLDPTLQTAANAAQKPNALSPPAKAAFSGTAHAKEIAK